MTNYGQEKLIWLNESGVPAWDDYPGPVWEPLSPLRASEREQADFAIQSAFFAISAGADALFHFQLYDGCGNQPAGTDFPPHNGELCDADNNYNGKPCAGDANGLYRNPADAACFTQHPQPETPRLVFSAFQLLADQVHGVEPYWQKRAGTPKYSATCPGSDGPQELIALYQPAAKKRIIGMWARCGSPETAVIEATDPSGKALLLAPDGSSQELSAVNGSYTIPLPGATNRNPFPGQTINPTYAIGGRSYILIETDYRDEPPPPTPTPTATKIPPPNQQFFFFAPVLVKDHPLGISGRIIDEAGQGVNAVTLSTQDGQTARSEQSGHYGFRNLDPGTYIVKPEKDGYIFQPPLRELSLPPGAPMQDFLAVLPTPTPVPYPGP